MNKNFERIPKDRFKGMKFECAPTSGVDTFQAIAAVFMKRILELDFEECLVTDESSIYDFVDFTEAELRRRILAEYNLDIPGIKSGNLLEIFRLIHTQGQ